jgi:hypothetical protein
MSTDEVNSEVKLRTFEQFYTELGALVRTRRLSAVGKIVYFIFTEHRESIILPLLPGHIYIILIGGACLLCAIDGTALVNGVHKQGFQHGKGLFSANHLRHMTHTSGIIYDDIRQTLLT